MHQRPWAGLVAAMVVLLVGCASIPLTAPSGPTAASTPSTYSVKVTAARALAIRELRAEAVNDWATMYDDRKASACFTKHWPTLSAYESWWTSNWGLSTAAPAISRARPHRSKC